MTRTLPFFQLEKKQGGLRITLGPSFGRTLVTLGVLLSIAFCSTGGPVSAWRWTSFIKVAVAAAKATVP
jgi:hypothetical protein